MEFVEKSNTNEQTGALTFKAIIMKCLLFLIIPLIGRSQDTLHNVFPLKDNKAQFERILEFPGSSADDIYKLIKSAGVNSFSSQKLALEADDKAAGMVAYKFAFSNVTKRDDQKMEPLQSDYWAIMKFYIKDAKTKVIVENINVRIGAEDYPVESYRTDVTKLIEKTFESTLRYATKKERPKVIAQIEKTTNDHIGTMRMSFIEAGIQIANLINMFNDRMLKSKAESNF